ncbi:hypothetical protein [Chthonomonas calidirosea]|uniref:hypothetical protein n=1 Tax=Chthonomonas calidirosea TaxID=454171 RepID=UPI0012E39A76|nr:hypothetical protein [Chthonomonas calidirosea]
MRRAGGTFYEPNTLGLLAAAALPITYLFLLEWRPFWQRGLSGLYGVGLMGDDRALWQPGSDTGCLGGSALDAVAGCATTQAKPIAIGGVLGWACNSFGRCPLRQRSTDVGARQSNLHRPLLFRPSTPMV